jgi:predicted  nucleic acid-binding Zn-ribbon protein
MEIDPLRQSKTKLENVVRSLESEIKDLKDKVGDKEETIQRQETEAGHMCHRLIQQMRASKLRIAELESSLALMLTDPSKTILRDVSQSHPPF